jgi:hypothetical protein
MANKVIPFPRSAPTLPQPVIDPQGRIIMHIGRQRFAIDISCQAKKLNSEPASVERLGGKGPKPPNP